MTGKSRVSRRERQLLEIVYKLESASAKEIQEELDDGSSDSTIRTLLRSLVRKGKLKHKEQGLKYVYYPAITKSTASRKALKNVVDTYFEESPLLAVNSLIEMNSKRISSEEIDQLEKLLKKTKREK